MPAPVFARRRLAAPFSPRQLPGLALWLDASDPLTLFQDSALTTQAVADADPVGGWTDKSGNGRNAVQATAGFRPTVKLAIQNGRSVLRFDGVDDWLRTTTFSLPQPTTVYMVVSQRTWVPAARILDSALGANTMLILQQASTPQIAIYANGVTIAPVSADLAVGPFGAITAIYNGNTNSTLQVDGNPVRTGANTGTGTGNGVTLAANAGSTQPSAIDVGLVAVCSGLHSGLVQGQMQSYLKRQWGTP